jgi:hypothetical protein
MFSSFPFDQTETTRRLRRVDTDDDIPATTVHPEHA